MGVSQTNASFQNDGNFSQLDLRDTEAGGPVMRIETFRCSQPEGEFGTTAAGTSVKSIAGKDHLGSASNRTFRHIFSAGDPERPLATLEIREIFDESGRFEVRTRDIDPNSSSFGAVLVNENTPTPTGVHVRYEVRRSTGVKNKQITSPLTAPITEQIDMPDLAQPADALGEVLKVSGRTAIEVEVTSDASSSRRTLDEYADSLRRDHPKWADNVKIYERMGDFRDKCIHPATNLTGSNPRLASEYILIRAYRMSLITLGRMFDNEMSAGAAHLNIEDALQTDSKPGVYSVFLQAYGFNIALYQLGLDKVHGDYGGIPMKKKPGSRLENGAKPVVDATNLNRLLAFLSASYFAKDAIGPLQSIKPEIAAFGMRGALSFLSN